MQKNASWKRFRIQGSAETAEVLDLLSERGQNHLDRLISYFAGYFIDPQGKCEACIINSPQTSIWRIRSEGGSSVGQSLCEEHHHGDPHGQVCILSRGRVDICLPDLLQCASLPQAH